MSPHRLCSHNVGRSPSEGAGQECPVGRLSGQQSNMSRRSRLCTATAFIAAPPGYQIAVAWTKVLFFFASTGLDLVCTRLQTQADRPRYRALPPLQQLRYGIPATPYSREVYLTRRTAETMVKVPTMAESISEGTLKQWSKRGLPPFRSGLLASLGSLLVQRLVIR